MQVIDVKTKSQIKEYLNFIKSLYLKDNGYVCTQKFNVRSLLYRQTSFARSCFIRPVIAYDNEGISAVCAFIHNPKLPYLQIGLFEGKINSEKAVELFVNLAKEIAKERQIDKILIGMNGHLSYGVGILEENFDGKMSFDSIYNKPYYKKLFEPYINGSETLCTYRTQKENILKKLEPLKLHSSLTIREANLKNFASEIEIFRALCDEALMKTSYYSQTEKGHFTELISGLKPFLRNENLLFALNDGKECGFIFWHPDYNFTLNGGYDYNLLQIYLKAKNAYKKTDTLKINAIGSNDENIFTTAALIVSVANRTSNNYKFIETTFIWDNNLQSKSIAQKLFGEPYRKYGVYVIEV